MKFVVNNIKRYEGFSDVIRNYFVDYYRRAFEDLKFLINDYDNSNNNVERFNVLSRLYRISYTSDEYIRIVNNLKNTNFTKIISLTTDMDSERFSSYYYSIECVNYYYDCLATDNFEVGKNKYSYDEIISLMNSGTILPIHEYTKAIGNYSECKNNHELIDIFRDVYPTCYTSDHISKYFNHTSIANNEYHYLSFGVNKDMSLDFVMGIIDSTIDKKKMLEDMKEYVRVLESRLRDYLQYYSYVVDYENGCSDRLNQIQKLYTDTVNLNKTMIKK